MSKLKLIFRRETIFSIGKFNFLLILLISTASPAISQNNYTNYPVFNISENQKIEITIEGRPVTAFTSPGMPSEINISKSFAQSLYGKSANKFASTFERIIAALAKDDFDDSPPQYVQSRIGPIKIRGQQRVAKIRMSGEASKQLVRWHDADKYEFSNVLVGPYAIPAPIIRFALRAAQPGETIFSVPLASADKWWVATTPKQIGKKKVYFAFAPQFETTLASAAAGASIAENYGGEFVGDAQQILISHNVARPARPVRLKSPLSFGPMNISKILVRNRDYGDANSIKEAKAADANDDEILVQARRKGTDPAYVVYIGNDMLKNCSSITYDKPAKTITLSCIPLK